MAEKGLASIKVEIENVEKLQPSIIDVEMIENQSGKIVELINSENEEFSYPLQNKYYSFKLNEAVYIKKLVLAQSMVVILRA